MNAQMHKVIFSYLYPILQNEAGVDMPLDWPLAAAGKPPYATLTIAAGTTQQLTTYLRRGMDFLFRTLRLQVFSLERGGYQQFTDATMMQPYSDLLDVELTAEGQEGGLVLSRRQTATMYSPPQGGGGAGLVFNHMLPERSTITFTFINRHSADLLVGGHLAGSVYRGNP